MYVCMYFIQLQYTIYDIICKYCNIELNGVMSISCMIEEMLVRYLPHKAQWCSAHLMYEKKNVNKMFAS